LTSYTNGVFSAAVGRARKMKMVLDHHNRIRRLHQRRRPLHQRRRLLRKNLLRKRRLL
jgi:hypothetical protein